MLNGGLYFFFLLVYQRCWHVDSAKLLYLYTILAIVDKLPIDTRSTVNTHIWYTQPSLIRAPPSRRVPVTQNAG